jgi:hypothetical protein
MDEKIEQLMNDAGLDIQYDGIVVTKNISGGEALEKFADALIQECIVAVQQTNTHHAYTSYDQNLIQATISKSVEAIRKHFE